MHICKRERKIKEKDNEVMVEKSFNDYFFARLIKKKNEQSGKKIHKLPASVIRVASLEYLWTLKGTF